MPAAARTLKQHLSPLLASAREGVSPEVNILQSGFGIVQFFCIIEFVNPNQYIK